MKTIFTHPNFSALANSLVKQNQDMHLGRVDFSTFKDGWPNIFLSHVEEDIEHKEVIYIGDFSQMEYLFPNYAFIRAILGYYCKKLTIIIPFFPVGTMERISKKGEVATSRFLADIFSQLPSGAAAKTSIHIFDIHTLEQRFFFNDFMVNTELHTAIDLIKQKISPDTVVVFPDEGAKKRFSSEFLDYEVVTCSKVRVGDERIITVHDGDVAGKEVVIIDDLIQTGGTIIKTAQALKNLGAKKVFAYATHGVFPEESYKNLALHLDALYTTDSIPLNDSRQKNIENFGVLSLEKIIQKKILQKDIL